MALFLKRVSAFLFLLMITAFQLMEKVESSSTVSITDATSEDSSPTVPSTTPTTPPAATTTVPSDTTNSFYCNVSYECSDPFTFDSTLNLRSEGHHCACREGWLTTGTCCLSQWWIIGLAAGCGAAVLLGFIIAVGCCCSYKSKAKKSKTAVKVAATHTNHHKNHNEIELDDDIKSHNNHHHPAASTAAMMTFAAHEHDTNHKPHSANSSLSHKPTDKPNHSVDAHHVTPTHVTPAHVTPASHGNDHVAPAHPVATTAAVAAVVHEVKDDKDHHPKPTPATTHHTPNHTLAATAAATNHHANDPHQHHHSPAQPQARSSSPQPPHHYQYQESRPYNRFQSQPAYQINGEPFYPANRHPPYGRGYSNSRYSEDNDSLETYDDTALPSTNYNSGPSGPGYYNYGGDQNGSSNKKPPNNENPNSSLLKIDSTSQFVINRPSVHF